MKRLVWLLSIPTFAQPSWTSIATPFDAYQYFHYWSEGSTAHAVEREKFEPRNPHPPYAYAFSAGPRAQRTVCALEDRPGLYWYSPQGQHIAGTFATSNPTEFSVSTLQTGIHGFGVTAQFSGEAAKVGAIEVAYFTDRVCSDAGVEYGFSRDLATDSILVYWSTFANCGNDAAGLCRKTNNPAPGNGFNNVEQEDGGGSAEHGFRIYGLHTSDRYTFQAFVDRGALRVDVLRDGKITRCSEAPNAPLIECSFRKTPGAWFPLVGLTSGYIVTGTQTVGDPDIAKGSSFIVSDILVAK